MQARSRAPHPNPRPTNGPRGSPKVEAVAVSAALRRAPESAPEGAQSGAGEVPSPAPNPQQRTVLGEAQTLKRSWCPASLRRLPESTPEGCAKRCARRGPESHSSTCERPQMAAEDSQGRRPPCVMPVRTERQRTADGGVPDPARTSAASSSYQCAMSRRDRGQPTGGNRREQNVSRGVETHEGMVEPKEPPSDKFPHRGCAPCAARAQGTDCRGDAA